MISSRHKRGLGVTAAAASLGLLLAALPTAAALADPSISDVLTTTVAWSKVDELTGEINDASARSEWTHDAFDAFGTLHLTNPTADQTLAFRALNPATRSEAGGVTTFEYAERLTWNNETESLVELTLTLEGSFARWSYQIAGGPALQLEFSGNLGADSKVRYTSAGSGIVSDDNENGPDPVIGFSATTSGTFTGWQANADEPDGYDWIRARATGSDLTVTVVYGDYSPCGFDEARAFIASITPDLASVFGTSYAPIGACLSVPEQTVTAGEAVDLLVPFAFAEGVDAGLFSEGAKLKATVNGLPDGLTGVVQYDDAGQPVLHLTGTATAPGTVNAVVTFSGVGNSNGPTRVFTAQPAVIAPGTVLPGTVASNVVVTVLAPAPKTVTFNSNGGSAVAPVATAPGTAISAPVAPTKAGHTFIGWFADAATTPFNFAAPITDDTTLTARWAVNSYTVTFESNGGSAVAATTAEYGSTVAAPAAPTRPGYIFEGWFADAATTPFNFATPIAANLTLTAKWSAAPANTTASQSAVPGQEVPVTGTGFIPGQTVEVWLHSTPVKLGTLIVAADGTVSGRFALPAATPAGRHHIVFVDEAGAEHRSGTITVAAAPVVPTPKPTAAAIAHTGADAAGAFGLAVVLLLAGAAFAVIRRFRAAHAS